MKKIALLLVFVSFLAAGCATTPRRDEYLYPSDYRYNSGRPVYIQPAPTTTAVSQDETNKAIIRQGLTGAAVGAIAAEASGGKAGTGALVGAGTNVIGGALINALTTPSQPQPQYVYPNQGYVSSSAPPPGRKIVRKYDSQGNIVSEEETLP